MLADDVQLLAAFYRDALDLSIEVAEENYVAFGGDGVRFAIFSRAGMGPNTHDHPDYRRQRAGQSFELNFECSSSADVDAQVQQIERHGGVIIAAPVLNDWGHYTAFFADQEGNIHSLFAVVNG